MSDTEPSGLEIAVIGMACRVPGADSPEAFWDNLVNGRESIRRLSREDLLAGGRQPEALDTENFVPAHGVVEDADRFDPAFFDYSMREASFIDPQQRMLLEVTWEALDRAGYGAPEGRPPVALFAGASAPDYLHAHALPAAAPLGSIGLWQAGYSNHPDFLATRVAYKLDLKGPAITVLTACSTSLVAVHLACQTLLAGGADIALAGGVSLSLPRDRGHFSEEGMILSPDGHCRAFDADAAGTVKGDGCGVVVLKRLADAIADGDTIDAVVLATASNNDGSDKIGFTAPSHSGQVAAIRHAQVSADIPVDTIGYIEAHGTGTRLGDPLEIGSLSAAFAEATDRRQFAGIGSVKSNVGHLDAAAGITSFIKAVLTVKHGELPPTLHYQRPNPAIDFAASPVFVVDRRQPWPAIPGPRRAALGSYGVGGTNAHVILEQAPAQTVATAPSTGPRLPWLLPLSARTAEALDRQRTALAQRLKNDPALDLDAVAETLDKGRLRFPNGGVAVAPDRDGVIAVLEGKGASDWITGTRPDSRRPSTVFLFPGQGAQHVGMARGLHGIDTAFTDAFDACARRFRDIHAVDVAHFVLSAERGGADEEALKQTAIAQCAIFAVEYALAQLWLARGVVPAALVGHSIGELTAAAVAGVFSLEDAIDLVALRGRLMGEMPVGEMAAVPLPSQLLSPYLTEAVSLAAENAPERSVIAGPADALAEALAAIARDHQVEGVRLHTSHAFHSAMMEPAAERFAAAVAKVPTQAPRIRILSTVTGAEIGEAEVRDPQHWRANVRQPVRFAAAAAAALALPDPVLLEVGPGTVLTGLARLQAAGRRDVAFASSLARTGDTTGDDVALARAAAALWLAGVGISWNRAAGPVRRVPLPSYPFARTRVWVDAAVNSAPSPARIAAATEAGGVDEATLYLPSWARTASPAQPATAVGERWIVIGGGDDFAPPALVDHALALGAGIEHLSLGGAAAALGAMATRGERPARIAIDLTGLMGSDRPADFDRFVKLTRAIGDHFADAALRIVIVTANGHRITGTESIEPWATAVAGFARVIGQELPTIDVGVVDIVADDPDAWAHVAREMAASEGRLIAWRGGRRWAQAAEPLDPAPAAPLDQPGKVYLVAGGLGAIGLHMARWLITERRARVALIGRTSLPDRAEWPAIAASDRQDDEAAKVRALRAIDPSGAQLRVLAADVADAGQMTAAIEDVRRRFGRIDVVIHAAGIVGNAALLPIGEIEGDAIDRHLRAKIEGAHVLERLFPGADGPLMLLFSSLSAQLGGYGGALYSAANAYLDGYAQARGGRWRAVNWDTWQLTDEVVTGRQTFTVDSGLRALGETIALDEPQLIVSAGSLDARWKRLTRPVVRAPGPVDTAPADAAPLLGGNDLERQLAQIWVTVLGVPQVGPEDNFFELGGDSVAGIQLSLRAKPLGLIFKPSDLYEHQTVRALVAFATGAPSPNDDPTPSAPDAAPEPESDPDRETVAPDPIDPPLSFAQQRFHFVERLTPGTPALVFSMRFRIDGPLDAAALAKSLDRVIARHAILRTELFEEAGEPRQRVRAAEPIALPVEDLSSITTSERDERAEAALAAEAVDLGQAPLIAARLLRLAPDRHWLILRIPHYVLDDQSFERLFAELATAYPAYAAGRTPVLPALPIQYGDHARAERAALAGAEGERLRAWWAETLKGPLSPTEIAGDRPRPPVQDLAAGRHGLTIDAETAAGVRALARSAGASPFVVWLALLKLLIQRRGGLDDIIIGTPFAGREAEELQPLIGPFINNVPLRTDLSGELTISAAIGRVRATVAAASAHQALPFEEIVAAARPRRDLGRSPLFQIMFGYLTAASGQLQLGDLDVVAERLPGSGAEFDLALYVRESPTRDGPMEAWFEYAAALYDEETIARLGRELRLIARAAAADPAQATSTLPLIDAEERAALITRWNATTTALETERSVAALLARAAREHPSRIAVSVGEDRLTFAALDKRAAALAGRLAALGAGPGRPVGILLDRTIDLPVALVAALKAGAAYVPVDPAYPAPRIAHMLADSGCAIVVTTGALASRLPEGAPPVLLLDDGVAGDTVALPDVSPTDLAYIIYTSGSTGLPKGVELKNANVLNFLRSMAERPGLSPEDRLVAVTTVSFDIHVLELLLPLAMGAEIVLASREQATDGRALLDLLRGSGATVLQATPATWRLLIAAGWDERLPLKALVGGEAWPPDLAGLLLPRVTELWNMYGPTETTVWSSATQIRDAEAPITIGYPIDNTSFHVTDDRLQPLPPGIAGELLIGGLGVAAGYHDRPELTADRFVADPAPDMPGRFYRTGDRAVRLEDGRIRLQGRLDAQVKLRGFRIEPGEIEAALLAIDAVSQAVAIVREDVPGDQRLVAYLVPAGTYRPPAEAVLRDLRERLPGHMIPQAITWLAALPQTPNGKVDRKALPAPTAMLSMTVGGDAPATPVERLIARLFRETLGVDDVRRGDNFFDLGGHSLLSLKVAAAFERETGQRMNPGELFQQSVAQIATLHPDAVTPEATVTVAAVSEQDDGPRKAGIGRRIAGLFGGR